MRRSVVLSTPRTLSAPLPAPQALSTPRTLSAQKALSALLALLALWLAWAPVGAHASASTVKLSAAFSPERLGAPTTVTTSLRVTPPPGGRALPVTEIELRFPAELGFGTSELGLEDCLPARLEAHGSSACPEDSLMGRGSALVQVPFGPRIVSETAPVTIFSQPVRSGQLGLLFLASGTLPVIANLVFGAFVGNAQPPFGGVLDTTLPLLASVPKGPDVALLALRTAIGPTGIVYREHVKGKLVTFHPKGMLLPQRCPRRGFPFAVRLTFSDGSSAAAYATVPCPHNA
jgi:hypothetical protein